MNITTLLYLYVREVYHEKHEHLIHVILHDELYILLF